MLNLAANTAGPKPLNPRPHSVSDTHLVEVTGLYKTYPGMARPAVDGIDLSIPQGLLFGLDRKSTRLNSSHQ